VKDGRVAPYEGDLESYRAQHMTRDTPARADKPAAETQPRRASRDTLLALRAEVRKCEDRVQKLAEMQDKLSAKLSDRALYEADRVGDLEVWNRKYAEVMAAIDKAEALWLDAQEKLERAEG
ncbi:MAG: ABC transporter ATP-binding protein, partial [Pseudodonghicola sp.]